MDNGSNKKWLNIDWEAASAIATWLAAIGAITGLIFLICELQEFKKANQIALRQSEQTERVLRQTYRPFGVVRFRHDRPNDVVGYFKESSKPDHFSFGTVAEVKNVGQGVLMFLGFFSHLDTVDLDFRKMFLEGAISDIKSDKARNYVRGQLLLQGETQKIGIGWEDLAYLPKYHQYTIYLYEDQDGNLYDTEHIDVFGFVKPYYEKDKKRTKFEASGASRELYHYYTDEEKRLLIKRLKEVKHPMVEVLEKR